ncbi:MAG: hypothetical protein ABI359_04895 [Ginsengibacter sp.]
MDQGWPISFPGNSDVPHKPVPSLVKVKGIKTDSLVNASDKGGYALTVITGITRHIHHLLTWRIANSPEYLVYY